MLIYTTFQHYIGGLYIHNENPPFGDTPWSHPSGRLSLAAKLEDFSHNCIRNVGIIFPAPKTDITTAMWAVWHTFKVKTYSCLRYQT